MIQEPAEDAALQISCGSNHFPAAVIQLILRGEGEYIC